MQLLINIQNLVIKIHSKFLQKTKNIFIHKLQNKNVITMNALATVSVP